MSIVKPQVFAQFNRSHPLAVGLLGLWPMLEGSGDTVNDYCGQNNPGTLTNMVAEDDWVGSLYGTALDFGGTDKFVAGPTLTSPVTAWTAFGLYKPNSVSIGGIPWSIRDGSLGGCFLQPIFSNQTIVFRVHDDNSIQGNEIYVGRSTGNVLTTEWAAIHFVWDGTLSVGGVSIYYNGVRVDTTNVSRGTVNATSQLTCPLRLGVQFGTDGPGSGFAGQCALFAWWGRVLREDEIIDQVADPFALLRPATPEPWLYYTAPATGGRVYRPTPFRLGPKLLPIGVLA